MDKEKSKFRKGLKIALTIVAAIWIVKIVEIVFNLNFVGFGVLPRETSGLTGILTYPFIHSNFEHLISNSFPILLLVTALYYFYPTASTKVLIIIYLISGFCFG